MSSDLTTAIVQRFFDEVCNGRRGRENVSVTPVSRSA